MYIEDLIFTADTRINMNPYDAKIITSLTNQLSKGSGLTEKQRVLALKILKRQSTKLSALLGQNIDNFLENPNFKFEKRVVNSVKCINVTKGNDYYRVIKVEFPFNDAITQQFREKRHGFRQCQWDPDQKAWIFSLEEATVDFLTDIAVNFEFTVDEEFQDYKDQIEKIKNNLETNVPMLKISNGIPIFSNTSNFTPQPNTKDPLQALFFARRVGIAVWDDEYDKILSDDSNGLMLTNFLKRDPSEKIEICLEDHSLASVIHLIKYLTPCLFIIPGGNEIEKIQICLDELQKIGLSEENVAVLFRLPKETGENFNNFVKNQKLNNPISDKIKVVFISSKIPKTIINPELNFNSVVNFNFYNVHYTIREFVKHHHNVLQIQESKPQRTINFGNL